MQARQRSFCWIFRYILHPMAKKITFLKGNLCIYKGFIDVLYISFFGAKEKLQNAPRFEMDFVLNFDLCSALVYLHERIHDPDSVTRIALKGWTFWMLNKKFQETASLSIVLSLFIHKISTKHDRSLYYSIQAHITRITFAKMSASFIQFSLSGSVFEHCSIPR